MITVKNLSFTYPGAKKPTLRELDFDISDGEIFGFLGPSGAGKSTTQKILYKILPYSSGEILIDGTPLNDLSKNYFNSVGVGFELPNHYLKLTGLENLKLFASFYPKDQLISYDQLFEMVDLQDAMNQTVDAYSKGMKMRLNFIRALMHNPSILFFDEPTAGLDPVNAFKIKSHIKDLKKQGKTIFITTHNMNTADELCDRVSFIVNGALQITDSPDTLKARFGKEVIRVILKNGAQEEFPKQAIGQNEQFFQFLQKEELSKMNTLEASLEEVFIQVTGQALKV